MSSTMSFSESDMAKRVPLAEQVPLDKPFAVRISPCCVCNFRCEYCTQSISEMRSAYRKMGVNGMLDFHLFKKIIDEISDLFGSVKKIILVGMGEPLLNPHISDMVAYIMEKHAADQTEIVSNGVYLSHEMSKRLIDAKLSLLRISVNGLSDVDYLKHCNVAVDFAQFIDQMRYFYETKGQTKLYVKIMNYMVQMPEKKDLFFRIFGPISDIINVEFLRRIDENIDIDSLVGDPELLNYTQFGTKQIQTEICPDPYYTLQFDEDGRVLPCCQKLYSMNGIVLGNIRDSSLYDIWTQKSYAFQRRMLDGVQGIPGCEDCLGLHTHVYPEDVLDGAADRLKAVYDAKMKGALS